MYLLSAIFMFLACVIYPNGWGSSEVLEICGTTASEYRLGECSIRWAYILAMLGIFDAAALALLAFFLAAKRAKIEIYSTTSTVTKCRFSSYPLFFSRSFLALLILLQQNRLLTLYFPVECL